MNNKVYKAVALLVFAIARDMKFFPPTLHIDSAMSLWLKLHLPSSKHLFKFSS